MKNNFTYWIRYSDDIMRPLTMILPKMSGYVKTFKDKNNESMYLCIDDDRLLEKHKPI